MGRAVALLGLVAVLGAVSPASAQGTAAAPVPGQGVLRDVPGAAQRPDPNLDYRVVFDIAAGAKSPDAAHPGLVRVARFVNTLAQAGVPADRRQVAVVLHNDAAEVILTDTAYAARHGGRRNASLPLLEALRAGGVDLRVCGQSVLGRNLPRESISPAVTVDLSATMTLVNLQLTGYVLVAE